MVIIGFEDPENEERAVQFLAGKFPYETSLNGDFVVAEAALVPLAAQGIIFSVKGPFRKSNRSRPKVGQMISTPFQIPVAALAPLTQEELKSWGL
jgi:hypothetical protein